jgi:hypothetical protein
MQRSIFLSLAVLFACSQDDGPDQGTTVPFTTSAADTQSHESGEGTSSSDGGASTTGGSTVASTTTDASDTTDAADTTQSSSSESGDPGALDPPAGGSSGGSGGGAAGGDVRVTDRGGISYRVIAPGDAGPSPAMIVFSGTEGGATMTSNLMMVADFTGNGEVVFGVIDGVQYNGDGQAGAYVLDQLRADYDIDNDRTYLLSESAGTTAGLELGLSLRQSYFAAYWANDVNASATPMLDAATLGFAPYGNAGPGGDFPDADAIVAGMDAAGYRTPDPAPYDGAGSGTHGDPNQFVAALQWFPGKTRQ